MEIESVNPVVEVNVESAANMTSEAENFVKPVEDSKKNVKKTGNNENSDKNNEDSRENKKVAQSTIDNTISELNSKIKMSNTQLQYSVDDETQRISIKVIDKNTDEVIREIPPEKTLEAIKKIWEIAGIIVDEKL